MRSLIIAAAALWLCGCSGGGERAVVETKAEPAAAPAAKKAEVTLTPEARKHAAIAVETVNAERVARAISATGQLTVNEDQTWSVGALHEGRVVSVPVKQGDRVRREQVLARIHTHDIHEARAAHKTAMAELERAQAAELQARRVHARAARLFELKAMSQQELEVAAADVRNAETSVRNAKTEVERERLHLTEYLEVPLEDVRGGDFVPVKSPADGVVIDRKATPGTVVSPGQEMFRITATSSLWMIAAVNEADLSHLRVGQAVRVLVRAYPDRVFQGRILRLGEALDPTTRTLQVRVLVPNAGGLLKPEMYASAEIEQSGGREAVFVADAALQDLNGNRAVFVETAENRFEARHVQTASSRGGRTEVVSGLRAGDRVVVKGSFVLKSELLRGSIEEE